MATKPVVTKAKKKWFTVLAPEQFRNKEIVDVTAFEPQQLTGRPVEVNVMLLTGLPKDQQRKLIFRITGTQGEKAVTEPWRYLLVDSFIQRSARRYKERFVHVIRVPTKDGKTIELKWLAFGVKKLHHPVRAELLNKLTAQTKDKVEKIPVGELFIPATLDKLSTDIKKELRIIFPLDKLLVWKLAII